MMNPIKDFKEYIGMNVGGKIYQTSWSTLLRYPNTFFDSLFEGSADHPKDEQGNLLLDRDGETFRHILNFLRYGRVVIPEEFDDFHILEREADFLSLGELKMALTDTERSRGDVGLNVGGKIYRASMRTLTSVPKSFFQEMLQSGHPVKDDLGNYLIDQDGEVFRHVLNFLKTGELVLPEGFKEFDLLEQEARSFRLDDLQKMVRAKRVRSVGFVINGQVFTLHRGDVLREKDSLFATIMSGEFTAPKDHQGNYIIERPVDAVHYLIHYIKHGGIFKDMTHKDVTRLKKEAEIFRLHGLTTLHLKGVEAAQGNVEDKNLFLYIIFDHRHHHYIYSVQEPCVAYINKWPAFFTTNTEGQLLRDVFLDGMITLCTVGSSSVSVGKVDVQKIKSQGNGRIGLDDFVAYFSTTVPGSSVDTIGTCGYFSLIKVVVPLIFP
ncbi:uncharacterized protein LOC129278254 [Lytechinus pictus]|uniref:uncharacterized protein LOC129278254 n=1 Tax=Lytechinus pictus TaxID=7653 RepID=UPI0030BA144F